MPGWSLDIEVPDPPDGLAWDLSKQVKKRRLQKLVDEGLPYKLIGSLPCTAFGRLQGLSKDRRDSVKAKKQMAEAIGHMKLLRSLLTTTTNKDHTVYMNIHMGQIRGH